MTTAAAPKVFVMADDELVRGLGSMLLVIAR